MKKLLIITLTNGREITRDVTLLNFKMSDGQSIPIGSPANNEGYAIFCQTIAMYGYTDPDQVNDTQYTHIAPSQIKTVTVKFEK